jgi:hypothetical protein
MGQCEKYDERGDMVERKGEDREPVGIWQASMNGPPQIVPGVYQMSGDQ